ncbi:hypothetical protein [Kitasatospora sp. NPDC059800]|uniref:hypothetical protein n=1 Tax=Kitasatospora sp. NPDC059800 TaxID=3346951 RepID=UPI00365E6FE8
MSQTKSLAREILATHREVEEWRNSYDPGSQEWHTLINLAETAARLVYSLPADMLPEEEVRTPEPREYRAIDEILDTLRDLEDQDGERDLDEALEEFQAEFPDICLTYWERWELEDAAAHDGGCHRLTDSTWPSAKDALKRAVYELVSSHTTLSGSVAHAACEGNDQ